MKAKKSTKNIATINETTGITLQIPNDLYYHIKGKADKDTLKNKEKKTIHDRVVDDLYEANKDVKRPK